MKFEELECFREDLAEALAYYAEIDLELVKGLIRELRKMKSHLSAFPEAAPFTSEPPIRKFIFNRFPYRARYVIHNGIILLLTFEHMSEDLPT